MEYLKILINTDDTVHETNIVITCEKLTPEIEKSSIHAPYFGYEIDWAEKQ